MKFNSPESRRTYSDRHVNSSWLDWCCDTLSPENRDVVDLGCGGGIYSRGFISLGARTVTGIDSSLQYLEEAQLASPAEANLSFVLGYATKTGLSNSCADIVFQRALIHHLDCNEQLAGALEMHCLLRPEGTCAVLNRTFEDVKSTHPDFWIRAALFETFPQLFEFERNRRPTAEGYVKRLKKGGFRNVQVSNYAETRRSYSSYRELEEEIMARKGKSILFELSDSELRVYCKRLESKAARNPLREKDQWSVWLASN